MIRETIFMLTPNRNHKFEKTLSWNDKNVNIKWPIKKPILSKKDSNGLSLNSI